MNRSDEVARFEAMEEGRRSARGLGLAILFGVVVTLTIAALIVRAVTS